MKNILALAAFALLSQNALAAGPFTAKLLSAVCLSGEQVKPATCRLLDGRGKGPCSLSHVGSTMDGADAITEAELKSGEVKVGLVGDKLIGTRLYKSDTAWSACMDENGSARILVASFELLDKNAVIAVLKK